MKATVSLVSLIVLITVSSCSKGTSKPSYLFKQAPQEGLAAKVGELQISNNEVTDGIESEIFEAESKVFELKFNRLKSILLQKYMDKDAKKKGMTNDEYLDKYIAPNVNISDKEIDVFIKDQNIPAEHINPQVKEKIKNYLAMERKKGAVDGWLAEQTKKTPVEVYITKPRRPTFPVEVGTAPSAGDKDAKVTIVEFSDFQCPFCAKGADILNQIKKKYGNKVRVAFKNFPLPFHNHAEKAAVAALCANEQGTDKFWKMHDEMFAHQDALDDAGLKNTAKKISLNTADFDKCLDENKYLGEVQKQTEEGKNLKVKSTPTFFVNGQLINGAQPIEVFSDLIDEEMAR